jgi:hypothetical protein
MLPRNQCSNGHFDTLPVSSPKASGKLIGSDHRSQRLLPGVYVVTMQSISKLYEHSSTQMTTSHRVPKWLQLDERSQALQVFHSRVAIALPFFDPGCDGVTTHAEGASESAQRATFFISTQYLLALMGGISIARRVVTTLAATISTQVFLFAIWREAITNEVLALAVTTLQFDSNHDRYRLTHHSMLSHYQLSNQGHLAAIVELVGLPSSLLIWGLAYIQRMNLQCEIPVCIMRPSCSVILKTKRIGTARLLAQSLCLQLNPYFGFLYNY